MVGLNFVGIDLQRRGGGGGGVVLGLKESKKEGMEILIKNKKGRDGNNSFIGSLMRGEETILRRKTSPIWPTF